MMRAPIHERRTTGARKVPLPTEAQIQGTCCEYLALDGWRRIRTDMKQLRGMGVQEPGMADDLFIRYLPPAKVSTIPRPDEVKACAEVLWVEWKAKNGVHGLEQCGWQTRERVRGALVWVAKQDFTASIEGFQEHYRKSGLRRNASL